MDSLFYVLLNALVATINANAGIIAAGATAQLGRIRPLDETELPFIAVFYTGDAVQGEFGPTNVNFQDWDVQVAAEISLDADATVDTDEFQRLLLNLRADVHNAIMTAAPTQGLSFVEKSFPLGGEEPVLDDSGKRKTVSHRSVWQFQVRTLIDDMTTN